MLFNRLEGRWRDKHGRNQFCEWTQPFLIRSDAIRFRIVILKRVKISSGRFSFVKQVSSWISSAFRIYKETSFVFLISSRQLFTSLQISSLLFLRARIETGIISEKRKRLQFSVYSKKILYIKCYVLFANKSVDLLLHIFKYKSKFSEITIYLYLRLKGIN